MVSIQVPLLFLYACDPSKNIEALFVGQSYNKYGACIACSWPEFSDQQCILSSEHIVKIISWDCVVFPKSQTILTFPTKSTVCIKYINFL